jgi:hypothetical protein
VRLVLSLLSRLAHHVIHREDAEVRLYQNYPNASPFRPKISTEMTLEEALAECGWTPGIRWVYEINVYDSDGVSYINSFTLKEL